MALEFIEIGVEELLARSVLVVLEIVGQVVFHVGALGLKLILVTVGQFV